MDVDQRCMHSRLRFCRYWRTILSRSESFMFVTVHDVLRVPPHGLTVNA